MNTLEPITASKIKEILEPIPADQWITDIFTDYEGKCCAVGHFQRLTSSDPSDYSRENCKDDPWEDPSPVRVLTEKFLTEVHDRRIESIANVNNDPIINGYTEDDPKARVMHLLDDMIKAGY